MKTFAEADKTMHAIETQWHFPIMTKYGFTSETPPQQGFVRSYDYTHADGHSIKVATGVRADYWEGAGSGGYWSELEPHLKRLTNQ